MKVARGFVTLVLFTEAHMTMPMAFSHTGMIYHKEIDIKIVRTCPFNLIVFCKKKGTILFHLLLQNAKIN